MNNFRKQIFRTLLPLMTFPMPFLLQSAVPEEMKIDLKTGMWCYLAGRQEKPVSHIYSETEKSISFRFQSDGVKWADVWLKKISPSLPVREKYLIRASFRVPAGSPVNRISLRMRDAEREIFQYPKTVDFSKGGTFTENWTVTDREWKNSWGGNKNHIPDMPIHFLPIKFDKLRLKLEAAKRAGYDKAITFEFSHFMSPQSAYIQAGHLYDRYKEYFEMD